MRMYTNMYKFNSNIYTEVVKVGGETPSNRWKVCKLGIKFMLV